MASLRWTHVIVAADEAVAENGTASGTQPLASLANVTS